MLQPRVKANNVFAVHDGLLQPVLPGWSAPPVPVHAVFASARCLTPKVRGFIDLAVETMRDARESRT